MFNEVELDLLTFGLPDRDVYDLKASLEYSGFTPGSPYNKLVFGQRSAGWTRRMLLAWLCLALEQAKCRYKVLLRCKGWTGRRNSKSPALRVTRVGCPQHIRVLTSLIFRSTSRSRSELSDCCVL
jgi:hypothetical protein